MTDERVIVQFYLTTEEQRELISILEMTMEGLDEIYQSTQFDEEVKDRYRIQNNIMNKVKNAQSNSKT